MDETAALNKAIFTNLQANATLLPLVTGTFPRRAPLGQARPYVEFSGAGQDTRVMGNGGTRIMTVFSVTVKAVTEGDDVEEAELIMEQVEAALVGKAQDVAVRGQNYRVTSSDRESPVDYTEDDNTIRINHYGGIYRYTVSRT